MYKSICCMIPYIYVCIWMKHWAKNNLSDRSHHSICPWWGLVNEWNGAQGMCCFFYRFWVILKVFNFWNFNHQQTYDNCVMYIESESRSVVSDSVTPWTSPWNSPGQNSGVGSLSLLQGIFSTQGLNPSLPHCSLILYQLSHNRSQCVNKTLKDETG